MGENPSSDSSTSTLTRCIDSANKRKRESESESDCDSFVRPLSMASEGHPLLWRELVNARLSRPPYQAFCNWENEQLWLQIAANLKRKNGYVSFSLSVDEILDIVWNYYQFFRKNGLAQLHDEDLNGDMLLVFQPIRDQMGCLGHQIPAVKQAVKYNMFKHSTPPLPVNSGNSSDEAPRYEEDFTGRNKIIEKVRQRELVKAIQEHSTVGFLTVRCKENLDHLKVSSKDQADFLMVYGPEHPKCLYALQAENDEDREILLRSLVEDAVLERAAGRNSSQPETTSSSSKRTRAR